MHEYSIVQAMFDQIDDIVRAHRALSVRRVRVTVGRRAGVDPTLLRTAYDVYRVKTMCDAAPLEIDEAAGDELLLDGVDLEVPDV